MAEILFVDEDQGMRELVEFELGADGHHVFTQSAGTEAIALLGKRVFDVVISDVRKPLLDGVEVLKAAKAASPTTQVIAVTAHADVESAVECVKVGAVDLLQKPFMLVELTNAVARALEHSSLLVRSTVLQECQAFFLGVQRPLVERIAAVATRLTRADDVSVMLVDGAATLRIAYSDALPSEVMADTRIPFGAGIAGRVALEGTPAVLSQAIGDDPRFKDLEGHSRVRSAIVYPLLHEGRVLGVLNLNRITHPHPFRAGDLEAVELLTVQAAAALHAEGLMQRLVSQERLAAIGQLSGSVVHEIKSPLMGIELALEFTGNQLAAACAGGAEGALAEVRESLADAQEGVESIKEILAAVKAVARGQSEPGVGFSINLAVRSAVRLMRPVLDRSAAVELDLRHDAEVGGRCDRLMQVFMHLLRNAAEAITVAGREHGEVTVRTCLVGARHVVVEVGDNGCGVAREDIPLLTQAFFTSKERDGAGLGLAISRQIVEEHGGELLVESALGQGTRFKVLLPLHGAAPAGEEEAPAPGPP